MNNDYINYMQKNTLSEEKKQQIYKLIKSDQIEKGASGAAYADKPVKTNGNTKVRIRLVSILTAAVVAICVTVTLCLTLIDHNTVVPPVESPVQIAVLYKKGSIIEDLSGNAICIDEIVLAENVTIGDSTYSAEDGTFLLLKGYADFSYEVDNGVEYAMYEFNTENVIFDYQFYNEDYFEAGTLNFREDLFSYYVEEDGSIHGDIILVFDIDQELSAKFKQEITSSGSTERLESELQQISDNLNGEISSSLVSERLGLQFLNGLYVSGENGGRVSAWYWFDFSDLEIE